MSDGWEMAGLIMKCLIVGLTKQGAEQKLREIFNSAENNEVEFFYKDCLRLKDGTRYIAIRASDIRGRRVDKIYVDARVNLRNGLGQMATINSRLPIGERIEYF